MRVAVMIALAALVAGCTTSNHNMPPAPADTPLLGLPHVDIPRPGVQPPGPGASVSDLERWISSARPVDPGPYHVARTGSGTPTNLGRDVAFTTPSGKIGCITDAAVPAFGGLSCLVGLATPPPRPASGCCVWVPGWTHYTGRRLTVGEYHDDPGPFLSGHGPQLPYGSRLSYRNFTCRIDDFGLSCADPRADSGIRISDTGIQTFGCLKRRNGTDVGVDFEC